MTKPVWADDLYQGLVLIDGQRVRWLNLAAARLLGSDVERAPGMPLIAVLRDHRLERAALSGVSTEVTVRGRVIAASPISGGLALLDVTEARRARESARELLAVLSHELRTPVTTVRAVLEAMRDDLEEEVRERFLDNAQVECVRLVRLIEDLTVESSPPRERRVEISAAVERAGRILSRRLVERNVLLEAEVGPLVVWADEDKLLQVLLNLIENAVVHGPSSARVYVRATAIGRFARVSVRDEGEPLEQKVVPALFEPRARARGAVPGRGLGLYIVRSLVERWGGEVWGVPGPDGNEFLFTVPLLPTGPVASEVDG